MNLLKKTITDIENLKIQGAQNIAKEALKSLKLVVVSSKKKDVDGLYFELAQARKKLSEARPTEPCLRNALKFVFYNINSDNIIDLKIQFKIRIQKALSHLNNINNVVGEIGSLKIKKGMVIFTHCHSSTTISIIKHAYKSGKKFEVHNTETRPLFQGRKTAIELSKLGINVTHYVDSAARLALKKADIMLIGCDAITSEGRVINKIGSELFAGVARNFDIPVFVCTDLWKFDYDTVFGFDEPIEQRKSSEVWVDVPKNIKIDNHAFEIIDSELITGVITELGVYKAEVLIDVVKENYKWMINKN